ncbi:laccase [Hysterangium stoloniferum]|nr:laccase [Hysterangium stoloniferum]
MRVTVAFLIAGLSFVQGRTRSYTFDIAAKKVSPDGLTRSAITVNGHTPGPVLVGEKGDDFSVLVKNHLNDPTMRQSLTIHWHGIFQHRTNYDDGPAQVTQCPIAPGHSYQYKIETTDVVGGGQTGTFWYHSHLGTQYVDGLRGAIVLYDPEDPHKALYDVDDQNTIITLTDWYHAPAEKLGHDWVANLTAEPVPDSNLLNGVGRYKGGPATPRAVINVVQGKRYRFRIINMSTIVSFNFTVEHHNVTVIEADGVSHHPYEVSSIGISVGQRYSVVLNANNPIRNYWIAYPSNFREIAVPTVNPTYNGTEAFAILRYKGAPHADPTTPQITPPTVGVFKEFNLKPLVSPLPPSASENKLNVKLEFGTPRNDSIDAKGDANVWKVNGVQYQPPKIPTLLQILSTGLNQTGQLPPDVIILPPNSLITVQIIGNAGHPFHLHGHKFQVIQSASGPRNEIDPPVRDTAITNDATDDGAFTIRFRTDNPGPWLFHCHIDWHLNVGLAVVFAEDPAGIKNTIHPPKKWKELCKIYNRLPPSQQ